MDNASSDFEDEAENDSNVEAQGGLQPFMRLSQLPQDCQEAIMASLQPGVKDVDAWCISVSPEYQMRQFCNGQSLLLMKSNRAKKIRDHQSFAKWMMLGEAGARWKIDDKFKTSLFKQLKRWRTIQESHQKGSATYGNALVSIPVLLFCLRKIGCREIRIQAFGQKIPLLPQFVFEEPAQPSHPSAKLNRWDIGCTTQSANIFLFRPSGRIPSGMQVYPMVIPRSMDFGSVKVILTYDEKEYTVKIYPRLVHVIKSFNSNPHPHNPNITQTLKERRSALGVMIDNLRNLDPAELGGFRLEISLNARSLSEAREIARNLPFLDIKNWLNPIHDQIKPFKLEAMVISKEDLLANVLRMLTIANSRDIWSGPSQGKVSNFRKQVVTDLFAALGWNPGRRHLTRSDKSGAWWREPDDGGKRTAWEIILGHLTAKYSTGPSLRRVFEAIQRHIVNGVLPCQKNGRGVYQAYADKSRFRLRCNDRLCRHILSQFQVYEYFSQLILQGAVPCNIIGLSPGTFLYRIPTTNNPDYTNTAEQNPTIQPERVPSREPVVCHLRIYPNTT